jgi:hypothetical protein
MQLSNAVHLISVYTGNMDLNSDWVLIFLNRRWSDMLFVVTGVHGRN